MYNVNAMTIKTFPGGVHLKEFKELTVDKKIRSIPIPAVVTVPLSQHIGSPNETLVNINDLVKVGQKIGESKAFVSAAVHSPVSGKVKKIQDFFHPIHGKSPAITIENDGKYESISLVERKDPETLSKEELIGIVKEAGIVGMGGATFPTHVKLNIPKEKHIDTLIVNGAECEPYLTCDHRLMVEKAQEILQGTLLIAKILGVNDIYFAIEENKLSAIFGMEKLVAKVNKKLPKTNIKVIVLKTKYPQGGEKQLIKSILKKEVPPTKLPLDIGIVVQNVGTCFAIYEAVYKGKPLIERCATFTGTPLKETANLLVRIGTPLKDVVNSLGGFKEEPAKIIAGGPMMGITQYTLETPFVKGMTGIVFLSKNETKVPEELPCIRCAKCIDICPVNLMPTDIMRMVKHSRWHYMDDLYPLDCIECGGCTYKCPSKIPLVQYIKLAKLKALEEE